jgi:regulator of protease activity HflC (stomatin/prohibitin superfamily)
MGIRGILTIFTAVCATIVAFTVLLGSWYTIDQGERGVVLRNGAIVGTSSPGLSFKTPWIEEIVKVSVQSQKRVYGAENGLEAYSSDQQTASLRVSVIFRVPAGAEAQVYEQFGSADAAVTRLLDPMVYEKVKTVFGRFNAATSIQERGRLNMEITSAIQASIPSTLLVVDGVQIEDISFDESYEQAVRDRMSAEVEVQKLQQNAQREKVQAQITVTQAQAKADSVLAAATAEAQAIRLKGDAEAEAIKARGDALRENPSLVALTQAEKWDGKLPQTMVPGGSVPMLQLSN